MKARGWALGIACFGFLAVSANAQNAYQAEYQRAIQGTLDNVQANGAIVASPSQVKPDYHYDWVRDTSVTMKTLVTLAYDPSTSASLRASLLKRIDLWINWELNRQSVQKLTGLGEPRFYLSGQANNEPWGRPQNDGPALRALTAMIVADHWIKEGRMADVEARLYHAKIPPDSLIKRDLEYVAHHWSEPSFDLWEEEQGMHFYTLTVQKVALLKGANLAIRMSDPGAASFYQLQAQAIQGYLDQFYDATQGIIRATMSSRHHLPQKTTDLDIAVVLAAIQTFDGQFYVRADQLDSTVRALLAAFAKAYPINAGKRMHLGQPLGLATGRYPGDVYSGYDFSGGNPWFLSTLAIAEYLCDANRAANLPSAQAQLNLVLLHMNPSGSISEQFRADNGQEQGARDLTWSYVSYLSAYRACFH